MEEAEVFNEINTTEESAFVSSSCTSKMNLVSLIIFPLLFPYCATVTEDISLSISCGHSRLCCFIDVQLKGG